MKDERQRRRTQRALAVCVALLAFVLPAPAYADDGLPSMSDPAAAVDAALASQPALSASETPAPVSAEDVAAAVDQAVQKSVQQAVDAALSTPAAVQPTAVQAPVIQPTEPQSTTDTAVSPVVSTDSTPPEPAVPDAAPQSAPTKPAAASDEPAAASKDAAAPAPVPNPVLDSAAPTVDAAALVQALADTPAASSTTDPGQYQDANRPDTNTAKSGTTQAAQPTTVIPDNGAPTLPSTWVWNWSWNCADNPAGTGAPPQGATVWIWNWNWDCPSVSPSGAAAAGSSDSGSAAGGSSAPTACSACNTSISIRILSPGNDGDVVQSNQSTSTSIAQNISTTVQTVEQSVQQVLNQLPSVQPAPLPPAASANGGSTAGVGGILLGGGVGGIVVGDGTRPSGIAVVPWPTPVLQIPYIVQPAPWPTVAAPMLAALAPLVDPEPILSGIAAVSIVFDGAADGAAVLKLHVKRRDTTAVTRPPDATDHSASLAFATTPRPPTALSAAATTASATPASAPAESRPAGAGPARKISKPGDPWRPPPPGPPGSEHGLSTGAAASGSSSSLGGFALLLAVLLVTAPPALPTLLAVGARRPRGTAGRRPERPG